MKQKGKTDLQHRRYCQTEKLSRLIRSEVGLKKLTWRAECLVKASWMEVKFFKLFDILHPAIVRWPEWRKYLFG